MAKLLRQAAGMGKWHPMLYGAYGPYFPREASPSRGGADSRALASRVYERAYRRRSR